jgi:hypothetical protein
MYQQAKCIGTRHIGTNRIGRNKHIGRQNVLADTTYRQRTRIWEHYYASSQSVPARTKRIDRQKKKVIVGMSAEILCQK